MDDLDTEKIEIIIQAISESPPLDEYEEPMEAMVTKFVVVVEWMDSDGEKWLAKGGYTGSSEPLTLWDKNGMLYQALFGDWSG